MSTKNDLLIQDWELVLKKAWSVRFLFLAGLLSGCEVVVPLFSDAIPRGVFVTLNLILIPAALIARIWSQKSFLDDKN